MEVDVRDLLALCLFLLSEFQKVELPKLTSILQLLTEDSVRPPSDKAVVCHARIRIGYTRTTLG